MYHHTWWPAARDGATFAKFSAYLTVVGVNQSMSPSCDVPVPKSWS